MYSRAQWLLCGQRAIAIGRCRGNRPLHHSSVLQQQPERPADSNLPSRGFDNNNVIGRNVDEPRSPSTEPANQAPVEERVARLEEELQEAKQHATRFQGQFSGTQGYRGRRQRLAKRSADGQKRDVTVPQWFIDNNITTFNSSVLRGKWEVDNEATSGHFVQFPVTTTDSFHEMECALDAYVYAEIALSVAAGFFLAGSRVPPKFPASMMHLALFNSELESEVWLQHIVDHVASELGANVVTLDAVDLAELAADALDGSELLYKPVRTLSFDVHDRKSVEEVEEDEGDEYDEDPRRPQIHPAFGGIVLPIELDGKITNITTATLKPPSEKQKFSALFDAIMDAVWDKQAQNSTMQNLSIRSNTNHGLKIRKHGWNWFEKISSPVQSLKDALCKPRTTELQEDSPPTYEAKDTKAENFNGSEGFKRRLIVCVRDFEQLSTASAGAALISALVDSVSRRREAGEQIIIVGINTPAHDVESDFGTPDSIERRQDRSTYDHTMFRAVNVPIRRDSDLLHRNASTQVDDKSGTSRAGSPQDQREGIPQQLAHVLGSYNMTQKRLSINYRHIISICKCLLPSSVELNLPTKVAIGQYSQLLEAERVLKLEDVVQIALIAIGSALQRRSDGLKLDEHDLKLALTVFRSGRSSRYQLNTSSITTGSVGDSHGYLNSTGTPVTLARGIESRLKNIRAGADRYEKQLMSGIVSANNISTTFDDVHAPTETIDALKTLTTLSLLRPDAFRYGVLKTDTIPGLLLYGPPGTGKTLLAKAVAKQSGVSMLSISGADINQMYVGEGEKMVRAVFTLAQKLSPCVVFIDEADSIFASRSSSSRSRAAYRDTLNQFLREWDGMRNVNIFMMVATNRPFDLDDAVLRRLPRRLLVDLPREVDRKAILQIHLKDETLAPDVSLDALAVQTPFYSGSDLKNMAVAAAIACVREENDSRAAVERDGATSHVTQRRVLHKRHFDKAMEEISASISEDMGSLGQIRKFDEQYGDRRGRKKRNPYGFLEHDNNEASARVRG